MECQGASNGSLGLLMDYTSPSKLLTECRALLFGCFTIPLTAHLHQPPTPPPPTLTDAIVDSTKIKKAASKTGVFQIRDLWK